MTYNATIYRDEFQTANEIVSADHPPILVARPVGRAKNYKPGDIVEDINTSVVFPNAEGQAMFPNGVTINGATLDNTDNGVLYVKVTVTTAPAFRVDLYKDPARKAADKVATATVSDEGQAATFTAENGSGITGNSTEVHQDSIDATKVSILTPPITTVKHTVGSNTENIIGVYLEAYQESSDESDPDELALFLVHGIVRSDKIDATGLTAGNMQTLVKELQNKSIIVQ